MTQWFFELCTLSFFVNLLALAVPIFVLQVYDRVVFFAGMSTLQGLTIGVVVAIVFDFIIRQARSRILQRAALRVDVQVGRRLFSKMWSLPLRILETLSAAQWQTMRRDVDLIRNVLGGAPLLQCVDLPFAMIFVAVIAFIASPVIGILLTAVLGFVMISVFSSRALTRASSVELQQGISRDALLTDMISSRVSLKSLDMGRSFQLKLEDLHGSAILRSLKRGVLTDSFSNLGHSLTMLTTVGMTVMGALAILDQKMTIGSLIAANMLANRVTMPFNQLIPSWRAWAGFRQAHGRLGDLFNLQDERAATEISFPRPSGVCVVESLNFRYARNQNPVIADLHLELKSGFHCIVGPSGSGKSTLVKLLQGLYTPDSGRVLLDGADIAQFSRTDLARWTGYVPQEASLISGTIRDNIARNEPDVPDEQVMQAAKLVGVHEFIVDTVDGYATSVGESGSQLSGGQRQRLAIARALLHDPPLLLLDEPTSNLDIKVEQYLCGVLSRLAANHTVVVVTHSQVLLSACETIIVMSGGRIVGKGPSKELIPRLFPHVQ